MIFRYRESPGGYKFQTPTKKNGCPGILTTKISPLSTELDQTKPLLTTDTTNQPQAKDVTISIEGMTCKSCVDSIEGLISQKAGIASIKVSLAEKSGHVVYDPTKISPAEIIEAVEDMGFDCQLPDTVVDIGEHTSICTIHVDGMTCMSCVNSIQDVVGKKESILNVAVDLEKKEAVVNFVTNKVTALQVADYINDMGFDAFVKTVNGIPAKKGKARQVKKQEQISDPGLWKFMASITDYFGVSLLPKPTLATATNKDMAISNSCIL